jgi:caffeoyl-CoA O-methyltransferase
MPPRPFRRATPARASLAALVPLAVVATLATLAAPAVGQDEAARMDPRLAEVNPILVDLEATAGDFLNAPRTHAAFLRTLIEMRGATRALEVGTSNGYSALWMGLGLERTGGTLTTVEIVEERSQMAAANAKKAGLSDVIGCVTGDALQVLPTLEGPFDFVFIDALKEDYWRYFELIRPKLAKGAVVVAHNAISAREAMSRYLEIVQGDENLLTTIVAIEPRDGMAITYVREGAE